MKWAYMGMPELYSFNDFIFLVSLVHGLDRFWLNNKHIAFWDVPDDVDEVSQLVE